ncbi:hypothetical protein GCM10009835_27930 [Planosporangium flavigriseum]|uniref:Uncharacterized protein n=1 Tax=Planosporangium flavigriseum TaxID=373681 RepID=A0A8J3PML0_9ACTN|nr:hypothetical protein Pfl04_28230 [Planosporangium flavigriseum]
MQIVSAGPLTRHLACSAASRLAASRRATAAVVGPARPAAGLIPYLVWNFLTTSQSATVWTPSTVIDLYPSILANADSTSV